MPRSLQEQYDALTVAISRVLTPVMICMALAVWFVHSLGDPDNCKRLGKGRQLGEIPLTPDDVPADTSSGDSQYSSLWAGIFIGIFVVLIVLFTFVLVWLYKTGRAKYIMIWLMLAVFIIFAYVGGLYVFDFCRSRCINLDWITLCVAIWNFTITGLFAVFGAVPRIINQAYLIVMSALMAYIFRTLPGWAVWTILAALVVWDLYAVLGRFGPLKMLVEAAREREEPLPALVYDTNPGDVGRDESTQPMLNKKKREKRDNTLPNASANGGQRQQRFVLFKKKTNVTSGETDNTTERQDESHVGERGDAGNTENDEIGVGTMGAHLKLGLGDFVFYSILVAQASRSGAMTTIASFVAILAGLCATLFLVTVYKKALPALPISISVGLLFYFLTRFTVQPFIENLLPELLFY